MIKFTRRYILSFGLAFLFVACANSRADNAVTLTVSVATSLQDAIAEVGQVYTTQVSDVELVFNFGSSGSLQHQIEQGAPTDIFISAAQSKMEALRNKNLIVEETHQDLLQNQIVAIAPKEAETIDNLQELTTDRFSKIALGDPDSVPAGFYSKEVLDSTNLYQTLQDKFVFGKDVRQVLSYVETGNVDAGFVYATDAKLCKNCQVIFVASEEQHSSITYPVAATNDSKNMDSARQFIAFLSSDTAQNIFANYGFLRIKN